jgi:hypothetical protein
MFLYTGEIAFASNRIKQIDCAYDVCVKGERKDLAIKTRTADMHKRNRAGQQ